MEQAAQRSPYLFTPAWDFLLLGGLWLLLLPVLLFMPFEWTLAARALPLAYLAYITADPHFMFSYQLLYGNFRERLTQPGLSRVNWWRHIIAGVVVPIALLMALGLLFIGGDQRDLATAIAVMNFLVGWHHTKQGYGVLSAMAAKKGIRFTANERTVLRFNTYVGWLLVWVYSQPAFLRALGFENVGPMLPPAVKTALLLVLFTGALATAWTLVRKVRREGVSLPWSGIVGYVVPLYTWLAVTSFNPLIGLLVPFFHALQYNAFAVRLAVARHEESGDGKQAARGVMPFVATSLLLGAVFMHWLPASIDGWLREGGALSVGMMVVIFVNIHHYFIDNAIWRHDNPEMRLL